MYLLIDWGNTHLKFIQQQTLVEGLDSEAKEVGVASPELMLSQLSQNYIAVLVCSVRNDDDNARLSALLDSRCEHIYFARTTASACGIRCAYASPHTMGVDRWAAVVAAASADQSVAVLDIGSAITLDFIKGDCHLGGQIAPGKKLMLKSLASTGRVGQHTQSQSESGEVLGRSTQDCVASGVDSALNGVLSEMARQLENEHQIDVWLVTGGGGCWALQRLQQSGRALEYRPFLVFEGLVKLYLSSEIAATD